MMDRITVWAATRDWDFRVRRYRVGRWLADKLFAVAIKF